MSLQNIQLPRLVITELYRDVLVDIDTSDPEPNDPKPAPVPEPAPIKEPEPAPKPVSDPPPVPQAPQSRIKFLGGNKKHIAFIVNCSTDVYLPDAQLDWLGKMLEACRLNLGDVAIANIAKNRFTITDIKEELHSSTIILLGTEPLALQLPLNFPHFNLQAFDGIVFLSTPSPDELNKPTTEAKVLKSKLWVCLQKLFKL
ncbi:MAG: hypothetical protein WCF67_13565 [Chitinophagaceae bacterium]